jgi:hypothetical protein
MLSSSFSRRSAALPDDAIGEFQALSSLAALENSRDGKDGSTGWKQLFSLSAGKIR